MPPVDDDDDDYRYWRDQDPDTDTELDDAVDECGLTQAGLCVLAGTEHCDWDCPFN